MKQPELRMPTQCADGKAHIAYFDPETQLSFVWSGDKNAMIEVCHGGYGEPVTAVFNPPYLVSVKGFASVCNAWIKEHKHEFL